MKINIEIETNNTEKFLRKILFKINNSLIVSEEIDARSDDAKRFAVDLILAAAQIIDYHDPVVIDRTVSNQNKQD